VIPHRVERHYKKRASGTIEYRDRHYFICSPIIETIDVHENSSEVCLINAIAKDDGLADKVAITFRFKGYDRVLGASFTSTIGDR
jgi:hypothetical protein